MRIKLDEEDVETLLDALDIAFEHNVENWQKYIRVRDKIVSARNYSRSNHEPRGFLVCKSDQG